MPNPNALLKILRQTHLYVGIFISPAILFFAFTGALQTFSLHEASRDGNYKPAMWILKIAQLHKNQNIVVAPKKPKVETAKPEADKVQPEKPAGTRSESVTSAVPKPSAPPAVPRKSHLPMKIFFLVVATSLMISTLTGIYMAYRFGRNKWTVTSLLIAGIVVPLILLPF